MGKLVKNEETQDVLRRWAKKQIKEQVSAFESFALYRVYVELLATMRNKYEDYRVLRNSFFCGGWFYVQNYTDEDGKIIDLQLIEGKRTRLCICDNGELICNAYDDETSDFYCFVKD